MWHYNLKKTAGDKIYVWRSEQPEIAYEGCAYVTEKEGIIAARVARLKTKFTLV